MPDDTYFEGPDPVEYTFVELEPGQVPEEYSALCWVLYGTDILTGDTISFAGKQADIERCITGVPIIVAVPDYAIQSVEFR